MGREERHLPVKRRPDGERGLALVLFAGLLVVLLTFAAFAVDLGAVYNLRRQDQSAADAAALAAVQEMGGSSADIVAAAQLYAGDNLEDTLPAGAWNTCATDPGALSARASGANCISYNSTQVRVRIPDQQYQTVFGRVAGVDTLSHSAFAVAGLRREGFGGVLPYAVTGPSASGGFGCLQSNSNGQASAWCGSTSGNFGFMDFSQYGNFDLGTSQSCGSGGTSSRLRNNTAMGSDHDLSSDAAPVYTTDVVDTQACPNLTPSPNAAFTQPGNNATDITAGLFSNGATPFPDGGRARLQRSNDNLFDGAGAEATVRGVDGLDDNPLWRYIPGSYGPSFGNANIPESCQRNQFVDGSNSYTTANLDADIEEVITAEPDQRDRVLMLLVRCMTHYMGDAWDGYPFAVMQDPEPASGCVGACTDPVFSLNSANESPDLYDIQYTPRFGYVPEIASFPTGSSDSRRLLRFRPLFIQRLLIENGSTVWDPGFSSGLASGGFQRVGETSVFVFPDGMLPGGLDEPDAPFQVGVNRFVRLIR